MASAFKTIAAIFAFISALFTAAAAFVKMVQRFRKG